MSITGREPRCFLPGAGGPGRWGLCLWALGGPGAARWRGRPWRCAGFSLRRFGVFASRGVVVILHTTYLLPCPFFTHTHATQRPEEHVPPHESPQARRRQRYDQQQVLFRQEGGVHLQGTSDQGGVQVPRGLGEGDDCPRLQWGGARQVRQEFGPQDDRLERPGHVVPQLVRPQGGHRVKIDAHVMND